MFGSVRIRAREVPKQDLFVVFGMVPVGLAFVTLIILGAQGYLDGPLYGPALELLFGFLFAIYATVVGSISVFTGGIKRWLAWTPGLGGLAIWLLTSGIQISWLGLIVFVMGVAAQVACYLRGYGSYSLASADENDSQSPSDYTPVRDFIRDFVTERAKPDARSLSDKPKTVVGDKSDEQLGYSYQDNNVPQDMGSIEFIEWYGNPIPRPSSEDS